MHSMKQLAFLALAAVLAGCAHTQTHQPSQKEPQEPISKYVKEGWHISAPLTVKKIEAREQKKIKADIQQHPDDKDVPAVPFGFQNADWQRFKKAIQPGDEIYFIAAPAKYWQHLAGWEGYVLVRNGIIIKSLATDVN